MNRRRLLLGGAGVVVVAVVLVAGGILGDAFDGIVDLLGNDYFLVAALGTVAIVLALLAVGDGDQADQAEMPDPEGAVTMPTPGDEFDERTARWRLAVPLAGAGDRREIRERLRRAAVESVRRSERCDAAGALERVTGGTWTDDPVAAAFLAGNRTGGTWLDALAAGTTPFGYAARRTADEIARRSEHGTARP